MVNVHLRLRQVHQLLVLVHYLHLVVQPILIRPVVKAEVMLVIGAQQHLMVQLLQVVLLIHVQLNR